MTTMTTTRRAAPVITVDDRIYHRRAGILRASKPIICPRGHVIAENKSHIREDGTVWCGKPLPGGQGECGWLVYVLYLPTLGQAFGHRRRRFAADVTKAEMDVLERLGLDADDTIEYFGAHFPERPARAA